tara:strand:- start:1500 stop:1643 length:144 start_codon:yes stop_codon:yes gene_type:complete
MTEEDDGVVFRESPEAKESVKKGFQMRIIFDLMIFSILAIIAITIGL